MIMILRVLLINDDKKHNVYQIDERMDFSYQMNKKYYEY